MLLPRVWLLWASCVALLETTFAIQYAYWGQNCAGDQDRLATYCQSESSPQTIIIAFLLTFTPPYTAMTTDNINIANADHSDVGPDIEVCKSAGKKIMLSIGGDQFTSANTGWTSAADAAKSAELVYNTFMKAGSDENNASPFGAGHVVDAIDLDLESTVDYIYYFVSRLRSLTPHIYSAPQCVFPDAAQKSFLNGGDEGPAIPMEGVFIQFYNNPCGAWSGPGTINLQTWQDWAAASPNPNVALYIGTPGSPNGAGSGWKTLQTLLAIGEWAASMAFANFKGFMVWDISWITSSDGLGIGAVLMPGGGTSGDDANPPTWTYNGPGGNGQVGGGSTGPTSTSKPPAVIPTSTSSKPAVVVVPISSSSSSKYVAPQITSTSTPAGSSSSSPILQQVVTNHYPTSSSSFALAYTSSSSLSASSSSSPPLISASTNSNNACGGAPASPPPPNVNAGPAQEWAQCGGKCYFGVTTCAAGLTCTHVTDFWSDCRGAAAAVKREVEAEVSLSPREAHAHAQEVTQKVGEVEGGRATAPPPVGASRGSSQGWRKRHGAARYGSASVVGSGRRSRRHAAAHMQRGMS